MKVIDKSALAREIVWKHQANRQSIGLVPTMGALHEGHLSLVNESLRNNEITVVSLFVNPIQFNNPEDFEKYPLSPEEDLDLLKGLGVDYVFLPGKEEMYPKDPLIKMSFGFLEEVLEGKHRPGHFNGVAIVVAKLFNIIKPTRAYFGQKDLQQFRIIEQLVNDFSLNLELVMMPIVREASGLAMSSRNRRLSAEGLETSSVIYHSLAKAARSIKNGQDGFGATDQAKDEISNIQGLTVEYLELVRYEDLKPPGENYGTDRLVLCFAGYVEGVRLIDNVIVEENQAVK